MKKNFKIIASVLVVVLLTSVFAPSLMAYEPDGFSMISADERYDILVNVDENFGMSSEDFSALLFQKLYALSGQKDGSGGVYDIVAPGEIQSANTTTVIDTTNLDGWYVYDHYNTEYWNNPANMGGSATKESAWMNSYGRASTSDTMRPACFVTDSYATASAYTNIADLLSSTTGTLASRVGTAHRMKEHIYSYADEYGKPGMWFLGYGTYSIIDFLYYPTTSLGDKNVKFTIDSSYVNLHAFTGAGFLFNAGIDSSGNMYGYVLMYRFSSPGVASTLTLYKINNNVTALQFHNATTAASTLPTNSVANRITTVATAIGSANITGWNAVMDIEVFITEDSVKVLQEPSDGIPGVTSTSTPIYENTSLTSTGYQGFGPMVHYNGSGHTCSQASSFKFSDLEMSFMERAGSALQSISDPDFIKGSNRYFINLMCNDMDETLTEEDIELAVRMRAEQVRYITNVVNPFLNDGGINSTGTPLALNGKTFLDPAYKNNPIDYDKLAEDIARYILTSKSWRVSSLPTLEIDRPIGIFYLMGKDPKSGHYTQMTTVARNYIQAGQYIKVFSDDMTVLAKDSKGREYPEVKREFTITYPDGTQKVITVTDPAQLVRPAANLYDDRLLDITSTSPLGTYVVSMVVTDSNGGVSDPVTQSFKLLEDNTPPTITWVQPNTNTVLYDKDGTADVKVTLADTGFGVAAYNIGYKYTGDAAPKYSDKDTIIKRGPVSSYDLTIANIPLGVYEMYLQVWDAAGNLTTAILSVDNRYDISLATVTVDTTRIIDGILYPETKVVHNGKTLREGRDYTLYYDSYTSSVMVMGCGNYKNTNTQPFVNPTSAGIFQIIVVPVGTNAPKGMFAKGTVDILPSADLARLKAGEDVLVELEVERVTEASLPSNDVLDIINNLHTDEGLGVWLDITAYISIGIDNPSVQLHELPGNIKFTFDLPKDSIPTNCDYTPFMYVAHTRSDNAQRIVNRLRNISASTSGSVTYELNLFSTYALVYEKRPISASVPTTGDNNYTTALLVCCLLAGTTATILIINKKRRKTQEKISK